MSDPTLRVVWVGGLIPIKGAALAVRAFREAGIPGARLTLVGDGPCAGDVAALVDSLECAASVELRGSVPWPEMEAVYRESDLLLFTSLRDSSGMQLVEAMAFGLPLIVLDHHGAGDFVPEDAAIRVPIAEPEQLTRDLAAALRLLAADPSRRTAMGVAGRAFAAQHRWPMHARAMRQVYDSVLGGN